MSGSMHVVQDRVFNNRTQCAPAVWLDGKRLSSHAELQYAKREGEPELVAFESANLLSPMEVEAVEVYSGAATVPTEFGGHTARCGVIAIWSKRG